MNKELIIKENKSTRTIWVDALKGFLIIVVVLGHALQLTLGEDCFDNHLLNIICSFQMPVFVAISGYLNYRITRRPFKDRIHRRALQLLIPFFIWSVLQFILDRVYTLDTLVSIVLFPDRYFWFLWVLFFIYLLFNICDGLAKRTKVKQEVIMLIACLLLTAIMVVFEFRYFGFQFIAYYFLFYVIGYYLNKYNKVLNINIVYIIFLFILWLSLAWFWRIDAAPAFFSFLPLPGAIVLYAYKFVVALLATFLAIVVFSRFKKENRLLLQIAQIGEISLGIYVFHRLTMKYLLQLLRELMPNCPDYLMIITLFVISVTLSVIVVKLLNKNRIASKYLLGKV